MQMASQYCFPLVQTIQYACTNCHRKLKLILLLSQILHITLLNIVSSLNRFLFLYRFSERGLLYAKKDIASFELGPDGLFFTGDETGLLSVWKWNELPTMTSN